MKLLVVLSPPAPKVPGEVDAPPAHDALRWRVGLGEEDVVARPLLHDRHVVPADLLVALQTDLEEEHVQEGHEGLGRKEEN